jgi:Tfp pilus assembly protein PilF
MSRAFSTSGWIGCAVAAALASCAHEAARDPEASQRRLALAQDYYGKHLVPGALVELEHAISLDPENSDAYYLLGVLKMGQGVEHLELAERAACLRGAAADAERSDATVKMREAERNFQLAIKYRPGYADAYDGLAVVAIYGKDFDAAVRYEQEAQTNVVFAENPIAKGNLGWAYYGKKDIVRAEKELREAVAKSPQFCVGRYRLAQVLYDQADYGAAADQLRRTDELRCPIQEAYRLYGLTQERLHEPKGARVAFTTCVALAPKSCLAEECKRYAALLPDDGTR